MTPTSSPYLVESSASSPSPNFEGPADENMDNVYDLTIGASDPADNLTEVDVTVTVTNVDEAGTVTLSSGQPVEGVRLTAILADPDGRSSNIRWQWARSSDGSYRLDGH